MKNHSNSSRRQAKKGALRRAIYDAQRPSYSQVVEAKALARKLMGIPDLHSKAYASKAVSYTHLTLPTTPYV